MAGNSTEYIKHHLTNLTYGQLPAGYVRHGEHGDEALTQSTWTLAHNADEAHAMGFKAVHLDPGGGGGCSTRGRGGATSTLHSRSSYTGCGGGA